MPFVADSRTRSLLISTLFSLLWFAFVLARSLGATEIPFSTAQVLAPAWDGAEDVAVGDVDGDGDLDVASVASEADAVSWWENTAGDGSAWTRQTIAIGFDGAGSVVLTDLDRDGDLDVVASAGDAGDVAWFENTAGDGSGWARRDIDLSFGEPVSVAVADLDGDGSLDVTGTDVAGGRIAWWRNNLHGAGLPWPQALVANVGGANSTTTTDLDADGDLDIVATGSSSALLAWFENTAGDGSSWTQHAVTTAFSGQEFATLGDADQDGDLDIFFAAGTAGVFGWAENTAGDGSAWIDHIIAEGQPFPTAVQAIDLDSDGDLDAVGAHRDGFRVSWWENTDGIGGVWTPRPIAAVTGLATAVAIDDLDGDGDLDVVAPDQVGDRLVWWQNEALHHSALPSDQHIVVPFFWGANWADAVDMDSDGDLDIFGVATFGDRIAWWENDGTDCDAQCDWPFHLIDADFSAPTLAEPVDLDGDGDLDVVASSHIFGRLVWWENDQSPCEPHCSWPRHDIVNDNSFGGLSFLTKDMDDDGDLDIFGYIVQPNTDVAWWENDGSPCDPDCDWPRHLFQADVTDVRAEDLADLDGDGDLDLVGASNIFSDTIFWLENDGSPCDPNCQWTKHIIDGNYQDATSVFVTDMDDDGDLDILGAAEDSNDVSWWENDGSPCDPDCQWTKHTVADDFLGARAPIATDLDADGDLDVVAAARFGDEIAWWENTGTACNPDCPWPKSTLVEGFDEPWSVDADDIDADGDLDILAAGRQEDQIIWWENRGGQFALPTFDAVETPTPNEGSHDVLILRIDGEHRGRAGDDGAELATLELLFESSPGSPLSDQEYADLVNALRIYRDDGDGVFEPGATLEPVTGDVEMTLAGPVTLATGVATVTLRDGDTHAAISLGATASWFVALDLAPRAGSASPHTFQVIHLTESSSTGDMVTTDIPLALEFFPNTSSMALAVNGAPVVSTPIPDSTFFLSTPAVLDVAKNFDDPQPSPLAFSATGLPTTLSISAGGLITGRLSSDDLPGSPYAIEVTATDTQGLAVSDTFALSVVDNRIFGDGFESGDTSAWTLSFP